MINQMTSSALNFGSQQYRPQNNVVALCLWLSIVVYNSSFLGQFLLRSHCMSLDCCLDLTLDFFCTASCPVALSISLLHYLVFCHPFFNSTLCAFLSDVNGSAPSRSRPLWADTPVSEKLGISYISAGFIFHFYCFRTEEAFCAAVRPTNIEKVYLQPWRKTTILLLSHLWSK